MDTIVIRPECQGGPRPLVSVVIACHNQGGVLGEAVRSAVARAVRVEIIVVDDGSTDHTAAVARGLGDVTLIRQVDRGLTTARNRGLRAASGEFVIFLDAGDRLLAGAIDSAVRALAARPDCAMAYGRYIMVDADGRTSPSPEIPAVRSGHHAALLQTNLIAMPATAIFRRVAVVAAGGFSEGFGGAAEYDLYLRLSRNAPIHDHGLLVAARRREARSPAGDPGRMLRETLAVLARNAPQPHTELYTAWRDGYARWQEFYGLQLVDGICDHLRVRAFGDVWRTLLALAALAPWVLLRELRRAAHTRYSELAIRARAISASKRRLGT
jgi:glycosyltransferase involved in cell wall biosynthesis